MAKKRATSVRMRIMRLALISVGVAVLAMSGVLIMQLDYASTRAYKSEIESLSVAYNNTVIANAGTIRKQIEAAARNEIINTETDVTKLKAELAKLAETTSYKDFSISETSGKTLNDTDISDREYFQRALAGETCISNPVVRKTDNSIVIMTATQMENGKILYGAVAQDALSQGLSSELLGEGGVVYVVDNEYNVVASSNIDQIGSKLEYNEPLKKGSRDLGNNLCAYFNPIEGTNWNIIVVGNLTKAHSIVTSCLAISLTIGVLLCVLAIIVVLKISRKITKPIIVTTERLENLAKGDLSSPVEVFERRDETEKLSRSLKNVCTELGRYINNITETTTEMSEGDFSYSNRMEYLGDFESIPKSFEKIHDMLSETITSLSDSANNVSAGSDQMATGAQMLAEGTARQATATDELSSTIADISTAVNHTARNAGEASDLSNQCASVMREQDEAMVQLLDAMKVIEKKSEEISGIMQAIEDITFQTKILSLNAAIEAARAGEVGKGFAVVADEVGNLAMKSAESAESSKELISSTFDAVKRGSDLVNAMAQAIKNVTQLSDKSASLIKGIAEDADKQAGALEQATKGIEDISQVIQTNSATAEESAASCEELSAQAKVLSNQVSKLKA